MFLASTADLTLDRDNYVNDEITNQMSSPGVFVEFMNVVELLLPTEYMCFDTDINL